MSRIYICPKCGSDAVKRTHRQGLSERFASLAFIYPYRCKKCSERFTRYRGTKSSSSSSNRTSNWQKRRREVLLYGVGILFFLALLSLIIRERGPASE